MCSYVPSDVTSDSGKGLSSVPSGGAVSEISRSNPNLTLSERRPRCKRAAQKSVAPNLATTCRRPRHITHEFSSHGIVDDPLLCACFAQNTGQSYTLFLGGLEAALRPHSPVFCKHRRRLWNGECPQPANIVDMPYQNGEPVCATTRRAVITCWNFVDAVQSILESYTGTFGAFLTCQQTNRSFACSRTLICTHTGTRASPGSFALAVRSSQAPASAQPMQETCRSGMTV